MPWSILGLHISPRGVPIGGLHLLGYTIEPFTFTRLSIHKRLPVVTELVPFISLLVHVFHLSNLQHPSLLLLSDVQSDFIWLVAGSKISFCNLIIHVPSSSYGKLVNMSVNSITILEFQNKNDLLDELELAFMANYVNERWFNGSRQGRNHSSFSMQAPSPC